MFQSMEIFNILPYLLILVLVVVILQTGVRTKGKALQSDRREIIINVNKFFADEFAALRDGKPTISVSDVMKRTIPATEISRASVYRILNHKKDADSTGIKTPGNRRPNTTARKSQIDSFAAAAIMRTIFSMYKTSFVPSLPDIHKALTEAKSLKSSILVERLALQT
ncbi:hypothetical protein L9F63_014062, partial [Diploptera punctata]